MKKLFIVMCVFSLLACGCGCGDEGSQEVSGRCYVKTADWLLNGDIDFNLYNSVHLNWPESGLIQDVFNSYNTDNDYEVSFYGENRFVAEEVIEWILHYLCGIEYLYKIENGQKIRHSEPLTDISQLNGKKEIVVYVAGYFN